MRDTLFNKLEVFLEFLIPVRFAGVHGREFLQCFKLCFNNFLKREDRKGKDKGRISKIGIRWIYLFYCVIFLKSAIQRSLEEIYTIHIRKKERGKRKEKKRDSDCNTL